MKLTKSNVYDLLDEFDALDSNEPEFSDKFIECETKAISIKLGIDKRRINVWWCGPAQEYCIYIDGKLSGYADIDKY